MILADKYIAILNTLKYTAILNTLTSCMILMQLAKWYEETLLCMCEQTISYWIIQLDVSWSVMWLLHLWWQCVFTFFMTICLPILITPFLQVSCRVFIWEKNSWITQWKWCWEKYEISRRDIVSCKRFFHWDYI